MRVLQTIKRELLYGGLSKEEFDRVKEPVGEHNRKSILSWSAITGLFCLICVIIFRDPVYVKGRTVLLVSLTLNLLALLSALFLICGNQKRLQAIPAILFI